MLALAACGAKQREKTLNTALVSVQAAREAFMTYDRTRQDGIVDRATSLEEGKAELAEYRAKTQARIVSLFIAAYTAIGVAAMRGDDLSLKKVLDALVELKTAVDALMKEWT